jgi:hypothetical protein
VIWRHELKLIGWSCLAVLLIAPFAYVLSGALETAGWLPRWAASVLYYGLCASAWFAASILADRDRVRRLRK